jgi:hypothetical protein
MKAKLLLPIALIAILGGSVIYSQTFKLNANPPLWPESQKCGGTNGRSGN